MIIYLNRIPLWMKIAFAIIALWLIINLYTRFKDPYDYPTAAVNCGAMVMEKPDEMGDSYSSVVYINQNWGCKKSQWYYFTTQGSNLLPYDFFMVLEEAGSEKLLRRPQNMNRYRYLVQNESELNPDALPVGFVKDNYTDINNIEREYVGFTCAACHTNQLNVRDPQSPANNPKFTAVRIDGGPAMAHMVKFLKDLQKALKETSQNSSKRKRFVENVRALGSYDSEQAVLEDLKTFALRIYLYNASNRPNIVNADGSKGGVAHYGYARLDAFGRIFNRVIEHLLTKQQIKLELENLGMLRPEQIEEILKDTDELLSSENRDKIIFKTMDALAANGLNEVGVLNAVLSIRENVFNPPNAAVSYPFLWDTPQHDYVQWNGIGDNSGAGPMGRNVGEVIGVFGTLDWYVSDKCSVIDRLLGNCSLFGKPTKDKLIKFPTSVDKASLQLIERQLWSLKSPQWMDQALKGLLPRIDMELAAKGKVLFDEHCLTCHHRLDRSDEFRKVVAFMNDIELVKTDPVAASNALTYRGKSGFLQDLYLAKDGKNMVMQETMPVASLLTYTTLNTVAAPDPDKGTLTTLVTLFTSLYENKIKASLKQGDHPTATPGSPYADLRAYKGRPLNGIWATAPYLHNGSVPTLYHLLLPANQRPTEFMVGSRELDTKHVGFKWQVDRDSVYYKNGGFLFETNKYNNSNSGHEYGIAKCGDNPSCDTNRWALVEYLKTL